MVFIRTRLLSGKSSRIVLEIDPRLKGKLYIELAKRQLTMKDWFISNAEQFILENNQRLLWGETIEISEPETDEVG